MLDRNQASEIIRKLISYTDNYAIVSVENNDERLTRFANSEIHQNVETEDVSVVLTVYKGRKEATCSTNVTTDEALRQLAADADELLGQAADGEFEVIRHAPTNVRETPSDARLQQEFGIVNRAKLIKKCIDTLDPDFTAAGVLSLGRPAEAFGNSDGAFHFYAFDTVSFEAVVTHKDGATGYGGLLTASLDDCDIEGAFKTAYDKAKMAIGPGYADVGSYTVILEPEAVANLMVYVMFELNARNIQDGTSFATGKLKQKIFGDNITINDDVNNKETYQRFFDGEGYEKKPLCLIKNGILENILYCSKTAQKDGAEVTGHAWSHRSLGGYPVNVVMSGGGSSIEEMIRSTARGILVTHFHYTNTVNEKTLQVTGLTRDGTFMIEDGKISHPIANMRFTENLIDAFSNVEALSKDLTKIAFIGGPALFPAMKINNFHFTSGQK